MSRRLDIGIASYSNSGKLVETVERIKRHSVTDWRLLIVDNPCGDGGKTRRHVERLCAGDARITAKYLDVNVGYAGAVNEILAWAETEYIAYFDNDAYVQTAGWDETLAGYLDRFHEVGMIFPNGGPYPINRGAYTEVLWGVGYAWMISQLCANALKFDGKTAHVEVFDASIGHQNEADACQRVRMAGLKCAAIPAVKVIHDAGEKSADATLRMNQGVVEWMNKWTAYFGGKLLNYHSPNVLRFEDWAPNALYLEEYYRAKLPALNNNPEVINIDGREYDLIRVPRYKGFYRDRII